LSPPLKGLAFKIMKNLKKFNAIAQIKGEKSLTYLGGFIEK